MSSKAPPSTKNVNVEDMTDEELAELRQRIDAEGRKREAKRRRETKKQIVDLARREGIDLASLASSAGQTTEQTKYRDPENQFNVWSGRGRKPEWVKQALARGLKLDDLKV
ncbi:MAG: H-NS histone family protein [Acidiphilium sp.]|nr:H-NS histone family protein [Acidiphilium sp.]MDD4937146.1 H-NS histone family protein [Acidiphilium sp.]